MRMKRFVVFLAVASLMMLTLVACSGHIDDGTKKSEFDMIEEVRNHDLGTYVSDRYDTMYVLGVEDELCLLKMPGVNQYILADNPDKGNHFSCWGFGEVHLFRGCIGSEIRSNAS